MNVTGDGDDGLRERMGMGTNIPPLQLSAVQSQRLVLTPVDHISVCFPMIVSLTVTCMMWMWFECVQCIVLCSVYFPVSCFEVKIEPESDDAAECPRDDMLPSLWTSMFCF